LRLARQSRTNPQEFYRLLFSSFQGVEQHSKLLGAHANDKKVKNAKWHGSKKIKNMKKLKLLDLDLGKQGLSTEREKIP